MTGVNFDAKGYSGASANAAQQWFTLRTLTGSSNGGAPVFFREIAARRNGRKNSVNAVDW